jgi:hypothetical protein
VGAGYSLLPFGPYGIIAGVGASVVAFGIKKLSEIVLQNDEYLFNNLIKLLL